MKKRVYPESHKNDEDFYFDDCLICQETKKAEKEKKSLNAEELKEIFEKANKEN